MKKMLCAAAIAAVVSGCVSAPTKTVDSADALQGKRIAVSHYSAPSFAAFSPSKALLAMVGGLAAMAAGNSLVKEDAIEDPAKQLSDKLAADLVEKKSATLIPASAVLASSDSPAVLSKTYPGADLILDVKTMSWGYNYYPTHWDTYHLPYVARIRLIDAKTNQIVAQQLCKTDPTDPNKPPTKEELHENKGALLKTLLGKAADTCVGNAEAQILKV